MTPTPFRLFELTLYTLINFLPYFFLALYPFKENFRFPRKVNLCLFTFLTVLEIIICLWASLFSPSNAPVSFFNTALYGLFFFLAIKSHPGKLLFILLMVSNMANQIVFSAKCLEGLLFPSLAAQSQRWSFSLTSVLAQLVFLPFFFLFIKRHFKENLAVQIEDKVWSYLWLIPGTFYLLWFYLAYFNTLSGIALALQPVYTIFAILINSGALLTYYVVAKTIREFVRNLELRAQNNLLVIQNLQYESLKERMDETKRARHDLRHHMLVLYSFCEAGQYEQLTAYLQDYLSSSPADSAVTYCPHLALNALLVYYDQLARNRKIDFSVKVSLPEDIPVHTPDLCVLFGNLLENAFDGCMPLPEDKRRIQLAAAMPNSGALVLTVDNTCSGQPLQKEKDQYLSSKHTGYGIGLNSVHNIAKRYNGALETEIAEGMFRVSVVLML